MVEVSVVDNVDLMFRHAYRINEQLSNCFVCSDHAILATTNLMLYSMVILMGGSPEKAQNASRLLAKYCY